MDKIDKTYDIEIRFDENNIPCQIFINNVLPEDIVKEIEKLLEYYTALIMMNK